MNLSIWLSEICEKFPQNVALIQDDRRITFETLNHHVLSLATHLKSLGINKGDSVAIMLPNCIGFVVSYFATLRCGGVAVTINTASTPYEMTHFLSDSSTKLIITNSTHLKKYELIKSTVTTCNGSVVIDNIDDISQTSFADISTSCPDIDEKDVAVMIYTAGLSGKALGAELTHGNILSQAPLLEMTCSVSADDRGLAVIPYFHAFGAIANLISIFAVGGSVVLMERFTIDSIFNIIKNEKVTYIAAVPRLFLGMLFYDKVFDVSSLRFLVSGGSAMPHDVFPAFEQKFGVKIWEGYGVTEASPVCATSRTNMEHKIGSVGVTAPFVETKIVDDSGNELPCGVIGELLVSGHNVMKGYHKNPMATAEVIKNGWLHTGDLAKKDGDGYIFITGVKKRLIITNGLNVYPREVERVLEEHPMVAKAIANGKPDALRGEIVSLTIHPKNGCIVDEKEILRFCREYLSAYKIPREIKIVEN
ncbi:MAG: AMP-binding protein [Deltaproteobacteria bacterium]